MTTPISVVIPTWRRKARLLETLSELKRCDPQPDEILVHVDAGDTETVSAVEAEFPKVRVLSAEIRQGPGGSRNRLLAESRNDIVVSFDDDSFPVDQDFFTAVLDAFDANSDAGVLAMTIIHDDEPVKPRGDASRPVADFVGCGCAYRRMAFFETSGYLPLELAYGIEEADLALQLIDQGWQIFACNDLRIRHATDREHQTARRTVAAHIANTALLAFLRYPPRLALYGAAQVANRILYSARRGHLAGVLQGTAQIPATLWHHRRARQPVQSTTVRHRNALRKPA